MLTAGYEFYRGTYHGDKITAAEWPVLSRDAAACLEELTLGRTAADLAPELLERCQMALCAVAEEYKAEREEGAGVVASESVGSWSRTYAQTASPAQKRRDARVDVAGEYRPAVPGRRIAVWPHTVTIWRRGADESYTAEVVTGCLWEDRRGEQLRKTGASASNGVKVYMPITAAIQAGDYAAKGEGYGAVRTAKDIVALGGLRVSEADRLDFGRLSHVEAVME